MQYKTLRFLFSFRGNVYKYGDTIEVEDAKDIEIPIREGCVECIEDIILAEVAEQKGVFIPKTPNVKMPKKRVNRGGGKK